MMCRAVIAVVVCVGTVTGGSAQAESYIPCGRFTEAAAGQHGPYRWAVSKRGPVKCPGAKRIAQYFLTNLEKDNSSVKVSSPGTNQTGSTTYKLERYPKWRCRTGGGGGSCRKDNAFVTWTAAPTAVTRSPATLLSSAL